MIRSSTGWILTLLFICIFSLLIVEMTKETEDIQSIADVLRDHVQLSDITLSSNSTMYDRNGEIIAELYDMNRIYIEYDDIPAQVINAFIATEDQRFYEHSGVDAVAIARALMINAKEGDIVEGASTITQQLARNIYLTHEQSYNRKFNEIMYAYELEKKYTKEEIIEFYLNSIYFSHGVYGIETAAKYYFNKSVHNLSLAEIAFLTAIPNNPTYYDPLKHMDRTKTRQQWVLHKMVEEKYITEEKAKEAMDEPIQLQVQKRIDRFPDYVTYIYYELGKLIAHAEGYDTQLQSASNEEKEIIQARIQSKIDELIAKGVQIETALDPEKQNNATETIAAQLPDQHVEGVAVIINHEDAEIVAITGGKNYNKFDFHRAFQSFRQPGSAIKPLLVYAPYFEQFDVPIQSTISGDAFCKNGYCPTNYSKKEYGIVTLETAFKHSYNTPAVRLLDRVGVEQAFTYLHTFSFDKISKEDYRLPAALGGFTYGVSPLELTRAFTSFAHHGTYTPPYGIQKVTDKEGNVLYSWEKEPITVWSQKTTSRMRQLLSEVVQSGTGRRAAIHDSYVGGKTGTTNNFHDLWFIGLTQSYTTGVWIGKDNPESIAYLSNRAPHLAIWKSLQR